MTVIAMPRIIQDKLTPEGAEALVEILDRVEERNQSTILEIAEERFVRKLSQIEANFEKRFAQLDVRIDKVAAQIDVKIAELRTEIAQGNAALRTEIARAKADLRRWTLTFIIGQFWLILGVLFVFFRR